MDDQVWTPECKRPDDLVEPVRVDPTGRAGPTRSQARGRRWQQVATGWYLDTGRARDTVEQRILGASCRLRDGGAVTAWASLRWQGGAYFDGTADGGRVVLPVPLQLGLHNLRPDPRVTLCKEQVAPEEIVVVDGLACTTPDRALFDEIRRVGHLRGAVRAADMAIAAGLVELEGFWSYVVPHRNAWTGVPFVRSVLPWIAEGSRSPQESALRLVYEIDAGLPRPLRNVPVFDLHGNLLGIPDLLDPEAGLVVEYDGDHHLSRPQRRRDVVREQRYRDHGLEYVDVVGGDLQWFEVVARRIRSAWGRALFLPPGRRQWTLDQPPWWGHRSWA